jgi:hypothetical protein
VSVEKAVLVGYTDHDKVIDSGASREGFTTLEGGV